MADDDLPKTPADGRGSSDAADRQPAESTPSEVPAIRYVNTDLQLTSAIHPAALVEALTARGLFPLYPPHHREDPSQWFVAIEVNDVADQCPHTPERTIGAMMDAVESLPGPAADLWRDCSSRVLDIGYESGDRPWGFWNELSADLLRRVVATNASIHITIYPPDRTPAE